MHAMTATRRVFLDQLSRIPPSREIAPASHALAVARAVHLFAANSTYAPGSGPATRTSPPALEEEATLFHALDAVPPGPGGRVERSSCGLSGSSGTFPHATGWECPCARAGRWPRRAPSAAPRPSAWCCRRTGPCGRSTWSRPWPRPPELRECWRCGHRRTGWSSSPPGPDPLPRRRSGCWPTTPVSAGRGCSRTGPRWGRGG